MKTKGRKIRHRRTKKHYRKKTKRTKHKKRRTKRRIKRRTKRTKRRMRGGRPGIAIKSSPLKPFAGKWGGDMAAFPPGPMYSPGINNDAKFYGKLNMPLAAPINSHGTGVSKGGGKKRSHKKSCKCKGSCKCMKQRGGGVSQFLANNIPGVSDLRDAYWKGGEVMKDGYNTWFGYGDVADPSPGVQPGLMKQKPEVRPGPDVPTDMKSAALTANKYTVA